MTPVSSHVSRRWRKVAVALTCAGLVVPSTLHAQTPAEAERAKQLFSEGSSLALEGKFAEACPKLEESQRLDRGLGTLYNLALCHEKIGRLGSAFRGMRAVARLARETRKAPREEAAQKKMEELRSRVSHLAITVVDPDTTVKVDGEIAERDSWSFYALDAGPHVIEASAPSKQSARISITIDAPAGGPGIEEKIAIPALAKAKGEIRVVTKETANTRRTAGFVVGGIGLAGVAAAAVTGIVILNDKAIGDDRCQPTCSDASARSAVATGKTLIPINYAAFGVAILGVGIGSYLVLTSSPKPGSGAAWLSPQVGPDGGGASVVGRF